MNSLITLLIGRRYLMRNCLMYRGWWFGRWRAVRLIKKLVSIEVSDELFRKEFGRR